MMRLGLTLSVIAFALFSQVACSDEQSAPNSGNASGSGTTGGAANDSGGGGNGLGGRAGLTGGTTTTGGTTSVGGSRPTGGTTGGGGTSSTTGGLGFAGSTGGILGSGGNGGAGKAGSGGAEGGGTQRGGATSAGGSAGTPGTGGGGVAGELDPDALFAAPNGTPGASGTLDTPTTLPDALSKAAAGRTIYLRGGKYTLGSTLNLSKDGSEASPIQLRAYPRDSERPLLDFSSMAEGSSNRGLILSGDYWHVYGVDVFAAGDNGMFVSGSHNTIAHSTFYECADTGLQLGGGASDNLILNCDSYFNADSSLENADGFAAKLDVGSGNKFVGCRAWNNLDDGWDGYLRPADDVTTTYEDCWAIDNGKLKDGSVGAGDGNGFKSGGSDDKNLRHNAVYTRCIASGNVHDGFDHNSNRGKVTILNSAAHGNGANINFSTSNIAASLTIKNTLSLGTRGEQSATMTDITNNSWQGGDAMASDFVSVDVSQLKAPRKSDGSLPDIDYLKLATGSKLRDAGVDVGLSFEGSAPDIGPFESAQ